MTLNSDPPLFLPTRLGIVGTTTSSSFVLFRDVLCDAMHTCTLTNEHTMGACSTCMCLALPFLCVWIPFLSHYIKCPLIYRLFIVSRKHRVRSWQQHNSYSLETDSSSSEWKVPGASCPCRLDTQPLNHTPFRGTMLQLIWRERSRTCRHLDWLRCVIKGRASRWAGRTKSFSVEGAGSTTSCQ